jgi:hypothetical protein
MEQLVHCGFFEGTETRYFFDQGLDYIGSAGVPEKVWDERFNDTFGKVGENYLGKDTHVTLRYTGPDDIPGSSPQNPAHGFHPPD